MTEQQLMHGFDGYMTACYGANWQGILPQRQITVARLSFFSGIHWLNSEVAVSEQLNAVLVPMLHRFNKEEG